MAIDKQQILHDLNIKDTLYSSCQSTPLMFSRDSSMDTLSSFNVNFYSHNSTYTSEHSTNPSGILSPSDIPDSPPRGCDDDVDEVRQQSFSQPLNNTNSTGRTIIPPPEHFHTDDDDVNYDHNHDEVDSVRNYASSPLMISYHNDGDVDEDDNDSIHSSLSSLTLPPLPLTSSGTTLMSNIQELRNLKHNLSVINEESLNEPNDRRSLSFNVSRTTTDDDDDDDDQKGKQLLFALIRQRLPHHHLSLAVNSTAIANESAENKSKNSSSSSSSSLCINDQTMREDSSVQDLSSHDITMPSSTMQESGYDSLLPVGSAPKRSLSNTSLSTTRSITIKKKQRCNEENDDPMTSRGSHEMTDDDDEHYDKKAGEALLRNLISQVLPSFNPRYLNGDNDDDEEILSNPRRPSPISRANSSSNASSIRSVDTDTDMSKKIDKNYSMRPGKSHMTEFIQQEKIQPKRPYIHKTVQQTKASELRRLQNHSRR